LSSSASTLITRSCRVPAAEDHTLPHRFQGHFPYWLRTRHPGRAELPNTRSCAWSCHFFTRLADWLCADRRDHFNTASSSANNCNDHRPYPAGGFPNRIAISFTSPTPSSLHSVGDVARFLRFNVASQPVVTNRSRRFSTVHTEQTYASAIFAFSHLGPSASDLSRFWA
jgi:hypothetical protein